MGKQLVFILAFIFLIPKTSGAQKKENNPPPISISSLFLKSEINNGALKYEYHYKDKVLRNRKYRIVYRDKQVSRKDENRAGASNEGDDIVRIETDLNKGAYTGFKAEGFFKNGYKNGTWFTSYNNTLVKHENWKNGLAVDKYEVYNLKKEVIYKTDFGPKGNGKYKDYYYKSGILKEEGNYQNGKKEEEWCQYDKRGDLVKSVKYKNGVPQ